MIKLVIADDHQVIRQALCEMLEGRGKYEILAQAEDGEGLLDLLQSLTPDLVIVDVEMPRLDGLKTVEHLTSSRNDAPPVLILSADERGKSVRAALKAGARGYLPKHAGLDELEFAISSIVEGKTYLSPTITASLVSNTGVTESANNSLAILTRRELEILKHLADGKPNRIIGKQLHISTRTVDTHRSNILKKLKLRTNAELVKLAISEGLITV